MRRREHLRKASAAAEPVAAAQPRQTRRFARAQRQTRDAIRIGIRNGTYSGMLPLEHVLAKNLSTSRDALRGALRQLADEGVVSRARGAGTYAIGPRWAGDVTVMESTADQVGNVTPDQSRNVTYRVIDAREVVAPEPIRVILELPPGAGVTLLERVATIDDQPLSLITCWTVADLGRPLLKLDLTRGFFDLLEQELDVTLGDAHGTIDAVAADDSVAALLNRALGSPLLYSETIVRLISGRPIAVISARSRPDRTITTTLRRRAKRARPPVETVPPSAGSKAAGDNQRALEPVQVGQ